VYVTCVFKKSHFLKLLWKRCKYFTSLTNPILKSWTICYAFQFPSDTKDKYRVLSHFDQFVSPVTSRFMLTYSLHRLSLSSSTSVDILLPLYHYVPIVVLTNRIWSCSFSVNLA
jgi:hypothetical protein